MAELLIKAVDATHADPAKDAHGCYKRGHVVDVRPDGFPWGAEEHPDTASHRRFVLVKVPGVDADKARDLLTQPRRSSMVFEAPGGRGLITHRRRFALHWDALPAAVAAALKTTRVATVPWTVLRDHVRDQIAGTTLAGHEF